jgi:anti-sigma regulatory factor (Ser/Thr protein kinase)
MPPSSGSDLLRLDLPCDREAPGVVREALRSASGARWDLGDVLLVASELVTNAVVHSGCEQDHQLNVRVSEQDDRVLIAVHDPGIAPRDAAPETGESARPGGWGLRIVDRLAERWGSERPDGHRVWAELPIRR